MPERVSVYSARDEMQAEFLAQLLRSHGIEATTAGGAMTTLAGYLPATYAEIRVLVDPADTGRARAVVRDFENARKRRREVGSPFGARSVAAAGSGGTWTCTNCGEISEAQFTDCWNCQAPRPPPAGDASEGAAAAAPPRPPPDPHIDADLPCVRCGYNLRKLAVDHVCPECAHPAFASLLQTMQSQQEWSLDHERELGPCLDYVEQRSGFPIEAIAFVTQTWPRALERASHGGPGPADVTPSDQDIADALRELATDFFGDPLTTVRAMQRWNLATAADVRRLKQSLAQFHFA